MIAHEVAWRRRSPRTVPGPGRRCPVWAGGARSAGGDSLSAALSFAPTALIVLALLAPFVSRRLTGDYLSPAAIVVSTWALGLGLCLFYLTTYIPLGAGVLWFIGGVVALLAGGSLLGTRLSGTAPVAAPPLARATVWVAAFSIAGAIGIAWYVAHVVHLLGWQGFRDGERLRSALSSYQIPSTFLFLQFFCQAAALLAWGLRLGRERLRLPHLVLPGICALGTLVTTDRTQFFSLLLSAFCMYCFARAPRLTAVRFLVVSVVVPLVLAANFVAVDAWRVNVLAAYGMKLRVEGERSRQSPLTAAAWRRATSAYFYATCSFPALQALLAAPASPTHGVLSAYPIARLLERAKVLSAPVPAYIPEYVVVTTPVQQPPVETNAYTFLYYPVRDFGRAGGLGYAALLGIVAGLVYGWARRDRASALRIVVVGQVSMGLMFLPFVLKFNNTAWWYVLAWTVVPFAATRLLRPTPR
jgi:hypothetical protein